MNDRLIQSLKKFLSENKRNRIENDGCATWTESLTELPCFEGKSPRISIVFTRYQGKDINKTILMGDDTHYIGLVLAIPSYWLEVDPYLCQVFLTNYVDEFINMINGESDGGGGSGGGGGDIPVIRPDYCPIKPPVPPGPPPRPMPPPPPPVPVEPPVVVAPGPVPVANQAPVGQYPQVPQQSSIMAKFNSML